MVWAVIGHGLLQWKILHNPFVAGTQRRDTNKIFKLTADSYVRRCLAPVVPRLVRGRYCFMQDGATSHTCRSTKQYLDGKAVSLLSNWPARSPDLNPIETLWSLVQRRVSESYPDTYDELCAAIDQSFSAVDMKTVNSLVASFPSRCARVVANQGVI
jgi:transposase